MTEIKYKGEIVATLESNQKAVLHLKDKKLTGDIDIVAPVPIEDWDGSVVIEGGVEMISFTIDEIGYPIEYQAESGMTWYEWCESDYDISPADPDDSYSVGDSGAYVWKKSGNTLTNWSVHNGDGTNVNPSDVIQAGVVYRAYANGGSND